MKPLLQKLAKKNAHWKTTLYPKQADLHWIHPNFQDGDLMMILNDPDRKIMCNRYPSIKELGDKDTFGNMMTFCSLLMPSVFDFAPPSFNLPGGER